jgi:hypothetical protein
MDIGPTPDVIELSEGSEPAAFLELFPLKGRSKSTAIPPSATHWRLKQSLGDRYKTRLFRVSQQRVVPQKKTSAFQVSSFLSAVGYALASSRPVSPMSYFDAKSPVPSSSPSQTAGTAYSTHPARGTNTELRPKSIMSSPATPRSPAPGTSGDVVVSVQEVAPFSWDDIVGEGVWVLDAFFEVYM